MRSREKKLKCPVENCDAKFNRRDRYESHLRLHNGERPFVCSYDDCDSSFTSAFYLSKHEKSHEYQGKRCTVPGCTSILKNPHAWKQHVNFVHLELTNKTYECSVCKTTFRKHTALQRHRQKETKCNPYFCPVENCEKIFPDSRTFTRHKLSHEVRNEIVCKRAGCKKQFLDEEAYCDHVKTVHRKPHVCPKCGKKFIKGYNKREHMKVHEEIREWFKCPVPLCTRKYLAKRNLMYHINSYHGTRGFTCDICGKAYKNEVGLSKHKNIHKKKIVQVHRPSLAQILSGYESPEDKIEEGTSTLENFILSGYESPEDKLKEGTSALDNSDASMSDEEKEKSELMDSSEDTCNEEELCAGYMCPICSEEFECVSLLELHLYAHINEEKEQNARSKRDYAVIISAKGEDSEESGSQNESKELDESINSDSTNMKNSNCANASASSVLESAG